MPASFLKEIFVMAKTLAASGKTNTDVTFVVGQCELGQLLVAQGSRGIRALFLGDDASALVEHLHAFAPGAAPVESRADADALLSSAVKLVEHPAQTAHIALDLRGTPFQLRVWQELQAIPAGKTLSYGELARNMGVPKAVRAVAGACAANKVAVAVPCHRVVRQDGSLSGYRWGIERKRALLKKESAAAF
jgi:AraC family transcriptional regulator, regulatory protein of adaptative response / methylated-DNA-[protein]-cysteine methyltransferase